MCVHAYPVTQDHNPHLVSQAAPKLTYAQRVGVAFVAFIQFYCYLHEDHGKPASELDKDMRSERGDQAARLARALDVRHATRPYPCARGSQRASIVRDARE